MLYRGQVKEQLQDLKAEREMDAWGSMHCVSDWSIDEHGFSVTLEDSFADVHSAVVVDFG